jgi:hypothetical protein
VDELWQAEWFGQQPIRQSQRLRICHAPAHDQNARDRRPGCEDAYQLGPGKHGHLQIRDPHIEGSLLQAGQGGAAIVDDLARMPRRFSMRARRAVMAGSSSAITLRVGCANTM